MTERRCSSLLVIRIVLRQLDVFVRHMTRHFIKPLHERKSQNNML